MLLTRKHEIERQYQKSLRQADEDGDESDEPQEPPKTKIEKEQQVKAERGAGRTEPNTKRSLDKELQVCGGGGTMAGS